MNNKDIVKERVKREIIKSEETLGAAQILLKEEFYSDAVSRAYYSMMHAAKAALFTKGVEASSHDGILTMFGLHFVKKNLIEKEYGKLLKRAQNDRHIGDYDASLDFSEVDTEKRVEEAKIFLSRIKRYLHIKLK